MHDKISPVENILDYLFVDDLWVVTCYFNPLKYKSRQNNFDIFYSTLIKSGINHIIVECIFKNEPYYIKKKENIIRVVSNDILWQKERLLNIAIRALPDTCKKVIWLDCDILFTNKNWLIEASNLLDEYKVIQPFEMITWLPKNYCSNIQDMVSGPSFAKVFKTDPVNFFGHNHGHTGFAWGAHTDILKKYGLYEACIMGGGDHMMAHAFCGDWDGKCVTSYFGKNKHFSDHYMRWGRSVYSKVRSKIAYCKGTILHLWHGDLQNRKYKERDKIFEQININPMKDIIFNKPEGTLALGAEARQYESIISEYLGIRKEDN